MTGAVGAAPLAVTATVPVPIQPLKLAVTLYVPVTALVTVVVWLVGLVIVAPAGPVHAYVAPVTGVLNVSVPPAHVVLGVAVAETLNEELTETVVTPIADDWEPTPQLKLKTVTP